MLETASIAGGATIAVFLVVIICIAAYIHCKRKQKELRSRYGSFLFYHYEFFFVCLFIAFLSYLPLAWNDESDN